MDFIDYKIIDLLSENSKLSLNKLSEIINLSIPSTRERILKLQDQGIITKYTVDIDFKNWAMKSKLL